jgi:hypothetical protein
MSLIEDEVAQALILSITLSKSLINTQMQIVSKHQHLFAGKNNEASLFFALRIITQQHRRNRKWFLNRRQKMGRKSAKNLKKVQQSKEFLDLVSKIPKNKFFKRPIRVDIDGTENIYIDAR